jgi:DNA mismatch repair protein MutL
LQDIITLLPDNIANQIAAGEVIQRPGSAVKELLENAVDAGATEIKLIVADAGKALIQVIDNGKGMSETDARMAFERHATSKIKNIEDLFSIKTMGFRGEALASIAAVAQVELKTKRAEDEAGVFIEIENSKVIRQEPIAVAIGTSIAMKNLFFNVPARRNFLKSNVAELRHIVDEFVRVAMAFPEIFFSLTSNGQQVFHLDKGNLKQRIVQVLGSSYQSKLIAVQEQTDYLDIIGFVGKPETAKKTRGDQYFFVNNRFIKSAYLNHAVNSAFAELIAKDSFPTYTLFIHLNPAYVDINVHPTKQEIKFEDEKIVYAFVQSAIKHALAQFSITPTLDFELDANIQQLDAVSKPFTELQKEQTTASPLFKTFTQKNQAHFVEKNSDLQHWKSFYEPSKSTAAPEPVQQPLATQFQKTVLQSDEPNQLDNLLQLHNTYIIAQTNHGFIAVHQQNAHERILYERLLLAINGKPIAKQQSLFPTTIELNTQNATLLTELLPHIDSIGFTIEPFGNNSFIVQATPANTADANAQHIIEKLLEQYKHFSSDTSFSTTEKLIRSMAIQQAIKAGTTLSLLEMQTLLTDLFACQTPNATANGKPTYMGFKTSDLAKSFGRQ